MVTARDIMHTGATCVLESETLETAARRMRELDVGALPVCGTDDRLHGIVTDRDIVVKCLAEGRDPRTTTAGDLAEGKPVTIGADADQGEVLRLMEEHRIRRLPVIEAHRLVGMISEADIARHLDQHEIAEFAAAVCAPRLSLPPRPTTGGVSR
ncbi:CBS domain-containing protein [Streptomyces sp. FH025]|uniref:CBS domain-containing protein n=1 Tax=Streptomyces sp. FH025 TaxID=2815937 RepID=UPI001A9D62E3|nr:CBS domain-containing protein [Streptomyces sp. FH025]MBO1413554.1 CBS domain-containing protein [Streptomyces sp. FH025]